MAQITQVADGNIIYFDGKDVIFTFDQAFFIIMKGWEYR